ncbi:Protein of uncharacterised function (DUF1456) [Klebsiella pneumoniae]|nr:Protein of uncharacterised function (DUF1456) [Klebsiella pneumoniae]
MLSNDILRSLRYTLKVNNNDMVRILRALRYGIHRRQLRHLDDERG